MNENMLPVRTVLRGGTYRIERHLSGGGFGNTYVVRHLRFNELWAVKEFFMKVINLRDGMTVTVSVPANKGTFESQRNKFLDEAQRLHALDDPHIVKVHDLFEENSTVYYVMDLIDGLSLSDIVKEQGPMSEKEAISVFRQMLEALSTVHSHVDSQNQIMLHLDIMTGKNFRLPTEAEWEYAARGGKYNKGYKYAGGNNIDLLAWYNGNSNEMTHPVGLKSPNELGLYDMSGNVCEWCQDWYGSYSSSSQSNPTGPTSGSSRIHRGGGWIDRAGGCRVSARDYNTPLYGGGVLGLRLAL